MLNHKNLVILYGVCKEVSPIYIVTEFMKHGKDPYVYNPYGYIICIKYFYV